MAKTKYVQMSDSAKSLAEIKHTNRLFLDLLYNLSRYPHTREAKRLVRRGLFDFEEKNVFRASKAKNKQY